VPVDHALEQEWQQARLIPTAGIRGQEEQEVRAASALLAVIPAVPQFGQAVLKPMKAPKGNLRTYTEVRLKDRAGKLQTPDGAIVVERGKRRWACVVEFKTGRSRLDGAQIERYLDAARQAGFDGLLTISNEITADRGSVPFDVDKRKVGALALHHLSWWDVLTEAILQHQFRGVTDPDQAYILGELVRYLTDERSGASGFQGMGDAWTKVREGARQGTLRQNDPGVREVAARWEQLVKYLCLTLSQELGVMVSPQWDRLHRGRGRSHAGFPHSPRRSAARSSRLRASWPRPTIARINWLLRGRCTSVGASISKLAEIIPADRRRGDRGPANRNSVRRHARDQDQDPCGMQGGAEVPSAPRGPEARPALVCAYSVQIDGPSVRPRWGGVRRRDSGADDRLLPRSCSRASPTST
jgi:hypothetical protein